MRGISTRLTLLAIAFCVFGCGEAGEDDGQEYTGLTAHYIPAIVSVKGTLYVAAGEEGVFRFNNKTQSWYLIGYPFLTVVSLAVDDTTLYVGTENDGIHRMEPDGKTLTKITPPEILLNRQVKALTVEDQTITAIRYNKLLRSEDGGNVWHQIKPVGIDFHSFDALAVQGDTIYVLTRSRGIFGSIDGGKHWQEVPQPHPVNNLLLDQNTLYAATDKGVYCLPVDTTTFRPAGLHNQKVVFLTAAGRTLYAATLENGVFRSDDEGQSWLHIGLDGLDILTLAFLDNRLYAGTWFGGLFYTEDEGTTWHPLNKGLNAHD